MRSRRGVAGARDRAKKRMLQFTHHDENILHYEVSDRLSTEDLREYYAEIDAHYRRFGKLKLLVRVNGFKGYGSLRALFVFVRHEPGLLRKVERYAAVAEQGWFRQVINAADTVIPSVHLRAFRAKDDEEAEHWLRQ